VLEGSGKGVGKESSFYALTASATSVCKQPYASLVPQSRPQDEAGEGRRKEGGNLPGSGRFVEQVEKSDLHYLVISNSPHERESGMMRL
jgi:hypothetical protein